MTDQTADDTLSPERLLRLIEGIANDLIDPEGGRRFDPPREPDALLAERKFREVAYRLGHLVEILEADGRNREARDLGRASHALVAPDSDPCQAARSAAFQLGALRSRLRREASISGTSAPPESSATSFA